MNKRKFGFTQIEMLIVVVVIAILAFAIQRLMEDGRRVKEETLRSQLHQLRNAIQQFEADCVRYPKDLNGLMVKPADLPDVVIVADTNKLYVVAWQGPYIKTQDGKLPIDPFTGKADWNYVPKTGQVHSSSTWTAYNGESYSSW